MKAASVLFLLAVTLSCVFAQNCTYGDYDLTDLSVANGQVPTGYQITDADGYLYYINFCAAVASGGCANPTTSVNQQTGVSYTIVPAVCQTLSGAAPTAAGDVNSATWSALTTPVTSPTTNKTYDEGVVLKYQNGEWCKAPAAARVSTIYVLCDSDASGDGELTYIDEPAGTQCVYNFYFNSGYGCAGGSSGGQSVNVGWIMILIFSVFFFVYVVIGVAIKFKKYDARGLELVPNYDFWKDIPFLIKDGIVFSINKISCGKVCGGYQEI